MKFTKADMATFNKEIDEFIANNWESCVADIARLVEIPSYEDLDAAAKGAPFGPGPAKALDEILKIAADMGFETHNVDGYVGYADFKGASDKQLGIIGHVDVVPAGSGWTFPPYKVTRKDGYLIGRGTLDDKGPVVVTLYALKYLKDKGIEFPYTIRFIFGCNEESGLKDVEYYRNHFADPEFIFTPDAEFPVCYGEKGGFDAIITSNLITDGVIVEFEGGDATNAVPGQATALVKANMEVLPQADRITLTQEGTDTVRIQAKGKSAHASTPEEGINAIGLIVDYLLANNLCTDEERAFLEFDKKLLDHTDGSGIGIKASDDYFGPLTVIGGIIRLKGQRFVQTLDSRYPTSITPDEIMDKLHKLCDPIGATAESALLLPPFLVKPDEPEIQALLSAFNEVTGEDRKPFTIGGGTYAREFTKGASFGAEMPWIENPDWVGSMHGPDEGISESQLKTALKIYALALGKLEELEL